MAPSSLLPFLVSLVPVVMLAAAAEGKHCAPEVCSNLTISYPFGVVKEEATETNCGVLGFQVYCSSNNTPFLQRLQILNIFYDNASLLVADHYKLHDDFNSSAPEGCHAPSVNSSIKLGSPFSISPVNQNLIFYNCAKPRAEEVMQKSGLVETMCRNNTYVRVGGRYDDDDALGSNGNYFLEGCNAIIVPVLGNSGEAIASRYKELVSGGFLMTWQAPSSPPLPELPGIKRGEGRKIIRIVLMAAAASLLFPCIYVMVCHRKGQILRLLLGKNTSSSTERNIEALIVSYGSLAPKRYNYSQ